MESTPADQAVLESTVAPAIHEGGGLGLEILQQPSAGDIVRQAKPARSAMPPGRSSQGSATPSDTDTEQARELRSDQWRKPAPRPVSADQECASTQRLRQSRPRQRLRSNSRSTHRTARQAQLLKGDTPIDNARRAVPAGAMARERQSTLAAAKAFSPSWARRPNVTRSTQPLNFGPLDSDI